jgi:hypothetical protein
MRALSSQDRGHPAPQAIRAARSWGLAVLLSTLLVLSGLARAQAPGPAADDPECLAVSQSSPSTYMIVNQSCPQKSILASIELADEGAIARCFVKKIRSQISIASEHAVPYINYQCIEGEAGCTLEVLRGMFPECHSG